MTVMSNVAIALLSGIFFIIIFAFLNRKKLRSIVSEGVQIYFDGEPREMFEVNKYDFNKSTGKIALVLNSPSEWGETTKTEYCFVPEDFSPSILDLDWRSYGGIIKCFKNSFGDVESDSRGNDMKNYQKIIKKISEENKTLKKMVNQSHKEYELENVFSTRKKEVYDNATQLRELKKLSSTGEVPERTSVNPMDFIKQ